MAFRSFHTSPPDSSRKESFLGLSTWETPILATDSDMNSGDGRSERWAAKLPLWRSARWPTVLDCDSALEGPVSAARIRCKEHAARQARWCQRKLFPWMAIGDNRLKKPLDQEPRTHQSLLQPVTETAGDRVKRGGGARECHALREWPLPDHPWVRTTHELS